MNSHSSQSKIALRPRSTLSHKSHTPSKSFQGKTTVSKSIPHKSTPSHNNRPRSVNQSYDFALDSSKMFNQPDLTKSKFFPSAVPSPTFDVHICREEISRLESQLNKSQLLESRIMKNDWRSAQKSMDQQALQEIRDHNERNLKAESEFQVLKAEKLCQEKLNERRWRDEEFQAYKAVKLSQEMHEKKKVYDELLREKGKFLHSQEVQEFKRNLAKREGCERRNSFKAYIRAVKDKEVSEKVREIREREFEYAQYLGAKWLSLKYKDQEVKENISVLSRLVN